MTTREDVVTHYSFAAWCHRIREADDIAHLADIRREIEFTQPDAKDTPTLRALITIRRLEILRAPVVAERLITIAAGREP